MGKKTEYKVSVVLTIKASTPDEAVSKAWGTLQYGYVETPCNQGPPKGLKVVKVEDEEVRI